MTRPLAPPAPETLPPPEVTVILPTHDARGPFLMQALESVFQQTFRAWTVIVVDNESTDGSAAAIEALAHPRIEVIRQRNLGPGAGRNTGVFRARTPWIAFLDSDDLWKPECLAVLMEEARRHPEAGLIAGRGEFFSEAPGGAATASENPPAQTPPSKPFVTVTERLLREGNFFPTSAVLCRASALIATGAFDPSLCRSEDTDLWLRLALRFPAIHLDQFLARIRLHSGMTQAPEDSLHKYQRRVYIYSKAMSLLDSSNARLLPLLKRRLAHAWGRCARAFARRKNWNAAADAYFHQWEFRPMDPAPVARGFLCRLRALFS